MQQIENSLEWFNIRLNQTEETIRELEEKSFKIIESEEQKEKSMKKSEETLKYL